MVMVNSHYVPQFILKNFYEDNKISYCDLQEKTIQARNTRSIFYEEGYYPEDLEKDLCKKAEHQFANLYHDKLENATYNITLTTDELFIIKKYLVVSAIRYKDNEAVSEQDLKLLGPDYKRDYNKSLNEILACDNPDDYFDILVDFQKYIEKKYYKTNDQTMAKPNTFLYSELKDIIHSYLVFVKPRGGNKFIIPDIGRGYYEGPFGIKKMIILIDSLLKSNDPQVLQLMQLVGVRDYVVYPLSKYLAVLTMNSFFKIFTDSEYKFNVKMTDEYPTVSSILNFGNKNVIKPPKVRGEGSDKRYIYEIKRLPEEDISHFNCIMMAEAKRYLACPGIECVQNSLDKMYRYSDRDYSFLRM